MNGNGSGRVVYGEKPEYGGSVSSFVTDPPYGGAFLQIGEEQNVPHAFEQEHEHRITLDPNYC